MQTPKRKQMRKPINVKLTRMRKQEPTLRPKQMLMPKRKQMRRPTSVKQKLMRRLKPMQKLRQMQKPKQMQKRVNVLPKKPKPRLHVKLLKKLLRKKRKRKKLHPQQNVILKIKSVAYGTHLLVQQVKLQLHELA